MLSYRNQEEQPTGSTPGDQVFSGPFRSVGGRRILHTCVRIIGVFSAGGMLFDVDGGAQLFTSQCHINKDP